MKRKILTALMILASSGIAMADSAQSILKKARDDYYKEQKQTASPKKEVPATEIVSDDTGMIIEEEEASPSTPLEKLEYNADRAKVKVDFYERVVRSVAREEKEINEYNEMTGKTKNKKAKKERNKTRKAKK